MPQPLIYSSQAERQKAYRQRLAEQRLAEQQRKNLPRLPAVSTMPGTARWTALVESARVALDTLREEMQAYADERSEGWQESERGEKFVERISEVEEIMSQVETLQADCGS
jgi:hypothetical protein